MSSVNNIVTVPTYLLVSNLHLCTYTYTLIYRDDIPRSQLSTFSTTTSIWIDSPYTPSIEFQYSPTIYTYARPPSRRAASYEIIILCIPCFSRWFGCQ